MIDKNRFFSELDAMGRDKVKVKVEQRAFHKKELSLVQEWFRLEYGRDFQTCVYHALKPTQQVAFSDAIVLYQKGWTDAPYKYLPGFRGYWYRFIHYLRPIGITLKMFWLNHWKWIITTMIAVIALYISLSKK